MKKMLYLACLTVIFYPNVYAQSLRFGALVGTNYSFDNHLAQDFHLGASAGASIEVLVYKNLFLRGDITFMTKQRVDLRRSLDENKFESYTVNAWQIPLNMGYRLRWKALRPYLQAGAYVHSAQNSVSIRSRYLGLGGRNLEYIRPNAAVGVEWRQWAIELDWQIGRRISAQDFSAYNQWASNFAIAQGFVGPCGCIPTPNCWEDWANYKPLTVRNDALLLKVRYYFNAPK